MKSFKVIFTNRKGERLSGKLEFPVDQKPYTFAIFAHCFTCNKNLSAIHNISRALSLNGIGVLRFDFTGLGESEGEFEDTDFTSNVEDLVDAAAFLEEKYGAPELIIGHSFGGPAALVAASVISSIKAVVTINSPFEPEHVKHLIGDMQEKIRREGQAMVNIGGRPFSIRKQFLEDIESVDMESLVKGLNKALLIMHSPQDSIVEIRQAATLYETARHPKSFISLDKADHLLSEASDSLYVAEIISSWMRKYISRPAEAPIESERRIAIRTGPDGFTTEIKAGNHAILADEPESMGGKDLGLTPYDLLVSGLGACTGMTLRMYADRKKWPLKNIIVHLEHGKVHFEDSKEEEGKPNMIDHIIREIELEGDLTEEQKQKLLEIANKCPVHKTLHSEISIDTRLL